MTQCTVEAGGSRCERPTIARSMCRLHYNRWWYHGEPGPVEIVAAPRRWKHGSSAYKKGLCRCAVCRQANTESVRRQSANRQAERRLVDGRMVATRPGLPHGRKSTYLNWGCRCAACTGAQTAAVAEYRRSRRGGAG